MKKLFIGVYNPSIVLTYISVFCAVFGIGFLTVYGDTTAVNPVSVCMILLAVCGLCDMFDGRIARMCKRTEKEEEFGIQLDSLADTVAFVVFPACILMYACGFTVTSAIVAMFYGFAGIMRLGWFNIMTEENKGFYQGLPVTFSAIIFPACWFVLRKFDRYMANWLFIALFCLIGILFVSNFKMKKPDTKTSLALVGIGVLVIIGLIVL